MSNNPPTPVPTPRDLRLLDERGLSELLAFARAYFGAQWIDDQLELHKTKPQPLFRSPDDYLVGGFFRAPRWIESLRSGTAIPDGSELLRFAMMVSILRDANELEGSDSFRRKLLGFAQRADWGQFCDTLFEGEAAAYWRDQIGAPVAFGPALGNPDFLASIHSPLGSLRLAVECKRIRLSSESDQRLKALADAVDIALQPLVDELGPMKVVVLCRGKVGTGSAYVRAVMDLVTPAAREAFCGESTHWTSLGDDRGRIQVSVAPLGTAGEFQVSPPSVDDVAPYPPYIVRTQSLVVSESVTHRRTKSVLRLHADPPPDRNGSLPEAIRDAAVQVAKTPGRTAPGAIAIRIRPPRGEGDLFEVDQISRSTLAELNATHIVLVILFWNEDERLTAAPSSPADDSEKSHVRLAYHLKPYFITNASSGLHIFDLDSQPQHFPAFPAAVLRSPATGEMQSASAEAFAAIATGDDFREAMKAAARYDEPLSEADGLHTIYVELTEPLPALIEYRAFGALQAGERQFRFFLDPEPNLRVVELKQGILVRTATVDLRAWRGQRELLFYLEWKPTGFEVRMLMPDEIAQLRAVAIEFQPR